MNPVQQCNACPACMRGEFNICSHSEVIGVSANGCFAEYVKVKYTHVYHIPDEVSFEDAALAEPLACATHSIEPVSYTHLDVYKRQGILGSFITFGDTRRGWNFRSLGHGDVDFEEIIRELNQYGYEGPLSVEWEDSGMERIFGATEACDFVRKVDFAASDVAFDKAIAND